MASKSRAERDSRRVKNALHAFAKDSLHRLGAKLPDNAAYLTVYEGMIKLKRQRPSHHRKSGGKRGIVRGYSRRSRTRLIERLNCLRWPSTKSYFGSLTYPDNFQDDPEQVKRDFFALWLAIRRKYGARVIKPNGKPDYECPVSLAWHLEPKQRKMGDNAGRVAAHYHFLAFNAPVDELEFWDFVRCTWTNLIFDPRRKSKADPADYCKALEHGTDIKPVESRFQATWYVSKYMAKDADQCPAYDTNGEVINWGRTWGFVGETSCLGNTNLDFTPLTNVIAFSHLHVIAFRLLVEQFLADRKSKFLDKFRQYAEWAGFTLYAPAVEFARYFLKHWIEPAQPSSRVREFPMPAAAPDTFKDYTWERPVGWKPAVDEDREPEKEGWKPGPTTPDLLAAIQAAIPPLPERIQNLLRRTNEQANFRSAASSIIGLASS